MERSENLYFIAIIPPEPIYEEVMVYKNLFANQYNSKAALKSPPHITLHMPFRLPHRKEQLLVDCLAKVAGAFNPVNLTLDGFGHFRDRVIFVKVKPNEQLDDLFKALGRTMRTTFTLFNGDYKGRGFNPHLTLAFRDLKRSAFKQAWSDFEERVYTRQFISRSLTLLKHNGKYWIISKDFSFN